MTISKEQLEHAVAEKVREHFGYGIKERIKKWEEYTADNLEYEYFVDEICDKIINGYESDSMSILNGYDEYQMEELSRWEILGDDLNAHSTEELSEILENGIRVDYYDSEWVLEDIAERFDEDYYDIYKNDHFSYCSSYNGNLYFKINGDKFDKLSKWLEQYSDDMTDALDDIDYDVCQFDINDLFNAVLYDLDLITRYEVNQDDLRNAEENTRNAIVEYLINESRHNCNVERHKLVIELDVIRHDSEAGKLLMKAITKLDNELSLIEETVTGGSK